MPPWTTTRSTKANGKCDTNKGWRLPTQREMLMVYTVKDLLEANSNFSKFGDKTYWTMTCDFVCPVM